jgi:hypothetical protein
MIGRRTLIRIAALGGASPEFVASIALPSIARPASADSPALGRTDAAPVTFKIHGWENRGDRATAEVWMSVDRSWRTAWR